MKGFLKLALGVAVLLAAATLARHYGFPSCDEIHAHVAAGGARETILFLTLCVLATLLFIPGTIIGLSAGVAFGPWWGTALGVVGASLGAIAAFGIARLFTRSLRPPRGRTYRHWLLFARLSPIVPFNALNFTCGALPVPFGEYVWSTVVGILPGTFAYVYFGSVAGCGTPDKTRLLIALGILTVLSFVPLLVAKVQRDREDE